MLTDTTIAPNVIIHTDSFDPNQVDSSVLCLLVGPDRFQVLVQNGSGQAVWLEDYTFPSLLDSRPLTGLLADVFRDHALLTAGPWQDIRIGINSSLFTLIPEPLYRKEYAGSYLALMRGGALPAHEFAHAHAHEGEGFLSVFNLDHPLADYFSEVYPLQPITFIHQTGALIRATADLDRRSLTPDTVYLYFENEFVTILYRQSHQLRYCNRFGYRTVQDLVYYVLYVLDEQQLKPDAVNLSLFGEITPFAEAYIELSRFLPNMTFGQTPPSLRTAPAFNELPEHRYLSLYGLGVLNEV